MSLDLRLVYEDSVLFDGNITHNLNTMADQCGIYGVMWRPDENGIEFAWQMIDPLCEGLKRLVTAPDKYRAFNPKNGWGSYETLVRFVCDLIVACADNRNAQVEVSR